MSSFKLWEIPQAIDDALENLIDPETGEMLSEDETMKICEALEFERDKKIEYLCKLEKNYTAEIEALKTQKQVFDARIKARNASVERIKNYIRFVLKDEKWSAEDASVKVSYRQTNNVVNITNLEAIPTEYFKTPHTEGNLNKTAIKEKLMDGQEIAGCELITKTSTIIK